MPEIQAFDVFLRQWHNSEVMGAALGSFVDESSSGAWFARGGVLKIDFSVAAYQGIGTT